MRKRAARLPARILVQWAGMLSVLLFALCMIATAAPAPAPTSEDTPASQRQTPAHANSPSKAAATPVATPTRKPSGSGPQDQDYNLHVTAQMLHYDDKNHFLTLDGNVVFTHLDTQITAPHAEFYTDKQIGYFTGGARITQPGTTITCNKVSAFYGERKAILTGNVEVITERVKSANAENPAPKPNPSTRPQQKPAEKRAEKSAAPPAFGAAKKPPSTELPTIMLCNELDYWWEKQEGDAIGDVKVRQGEKRAFSDRAHYIGNDVREVHMYSNCRFERGTKDWMTSEEALIEMNTSTFTAIGDVEAKVNLESTPTPPPPLTTPKGDRVLKPAPPVAPDVRHAPDGFPHDIKNTNPPPAEPEEPPGDTSPAKPVH